MLDFITAPVTRMWLYNIMVAVMAALFAVASANVDKPGKHEKEN